MFHNNVGRIYLQLGELESLLQPKPDDAPALTDLGNLLMQEDRVEEAAAYERAVGLQPDNPGMRFNLALSLAGLNRYAEALPHLERAKTLQPEDAQISRLLANVKMSV